MLSTNFLNITTIICRITIRIKDIKNELVFKTEEFALNPNVLKLELLQFESNFSYIK